MVFLVSDPGVIVCENLVVVWDFLAVVRAVGVCTYMKINKMLGYKFHILFDKTLTSNYFDKPPVPFRKGKPQPVYFQ